jgi:hypothetical protein
MAGTLLRVKLLLPQISQNPKLAKLNLPMLEAIGGPLIIQNNSALTSLESLEHLGAVNATGKVPSITIPGLQVGLFAHRFRHSSDEFCSPFACLGGSLKGVPCEVSIACSAGAHVHIAIAV